jgi:hypothetical protein
MMMKIGRLIFLLAAGLLLAAELILFRHTLLYHAQSRQPLVLAAATDMPATGTDRFVSLTGVIADPPLAITSKSLCAAAFRLEGMPHIAIFDINGIPASDQNPGIFTGRLVPIERAPFNQEIATHFNNAGTGVAYVLLTNVVPDTRILLLFIGAFIAVILLLFASSRLWSQTA